MMVYVRDCIIKVKNGIARVRSESTVYCPDCGRKLFFHGTCKRKVRAQEKTRCYVLRVLFCKNCKKTHRELPDFIVGYKRYSRDELCEIVMNEESYSCEDSTPGVEHRKHTDNLTHPHPLPSSRIDNSSNNSDCKTSAAVFLHLRHGTPFHSFYRPQSEKTYAACNIPPGKLENRTVSDHCSLSARESVRTLDSTVPPTHPAAVTGSSPFPAGPVPGSNP